jgi:putative flippase GtrA
MIRSALRRGPIKSGVELLALPATRQLLRYALAGFCVTQFAAGVYSVIIFIFAIDPLKANAVSTAFGLAAGYLAHSRFSFAVGSSDREHLQLGRFLLASLLAFLINSFWIWLLVNQMHMSPFAPVPLMMVATPCISFLLNRYWVFRAY